MALRHAGRMRGQTGRLPQIKALALRKFDQFGDWHYFWMLGPCLRAW
jgi:hypothetical protein